MYDELTRGNVLYKRKLPLFDGVAMEVNIVKTVRGAEYGFVPVRRAPAHLWIEDQGYMIKLFDQKTLFVAISDWHARTLEKTQERHPEQSLRGGEEQERKVEPR